MVYSLQRPGRRPLDPASSLKRRYICKCLVQLTFLTFIFIIITNNLHLIHNINKYVRNADDSYDKNDAQKVGYDDSLPTIIELPKEKQPSKTQTITTTTTTTTSNTAEPPPAECTKEELLKIRKQLPPENCAETYIKGNPWLQKCSLTAATKCPEATWLDDYYKELEQEMTDDDNGYFIGVSIGCNKGFDAVNTFRMGTFDKNITKSAWSEAMRRNDGKLYSSVCRQETTPPFPLSPDATYKPRKGEMHCIEPMPSTFHKLNSSTNELGYKHKGFYAVNAAVSKKSGSMLFPTGGEGGVENQGLGTCKTTGPTCQSVTVFSLKDYAQQNILERPINVLSIDVEGFDGDVILGASKELLQQVEYLEFEYNWMGSWTKQHLYDIVQMLNDKVGMTCYWAGKDRLWRITNCWMVYYDVHTWSNVACVNRNVKGLAERMEAKFQWTLEDDKVWTDGGVKSEKSEYEDHVILSVDGNLTKKYIE